MGQIGEGQGRQSISFKIAALCYEAQEEKSLGDLLALLKQEHEWAMDAL